MLANDDRPIFHSQMEKKTLFTNILFAFILGGPQCIK